MTVKEYYRLMDDANECRYLGTFDDAIPPGNEGGKCQTADALARFGISEELARKIIHALEYDYTPIDRLLPICCEEHKKFLDALKEAATSGSPVQLGPQHQSGHGHGRSALASGRPRPPST